MKNFLQFGRKKELFYCMIEFDKEINVTTLLEVLILFDKYYGGYKVDTEFGEEKETWHDFVIAGKINNAIKEDTTFYFDLPFYLQNGNHVTKKIVKEGCKISIFLGKEENSEKNSLLFDLYADLFTDIVYVLTPSNPKYAEWHQKKAARRNRKVLSAFLKALESMLEGNIIEYSSVYHLNPNSIFKYGIKEDATCEKPTVFD